MEPFSMAAAAAAAASNPEIQNAMLGVGRGLGRGLNYGLQGAGNMVQQAGTGIADTLGALGEQYLPQRVNQIGGVARQGLGLASRGIGGFYNAVTGQDQQGMQGQMPMQPQVMQGQMGNQMMGGQMGMQNQMTPMEQLQLNYMQRIQQPYQYDYADEEQQLMNRYNQEILPQLAARHAGGGGLGTGYYQRALQGASRNLLTDLRALGQQGRREENLLNAQQLRDQGQFALGQGQLGLGQRQYRQAGNIAQQENALRQMGAMGGFGQQQQQNYMEQLLNRLNTQGNLANIGMNQAYQQVQRPLDPGVNWANVGGQVLQQIPRIAAAYGSGGMSEVFNQFKNPNNPNR